MTETRKTFGTSVLGTLVAGIASVGLLIGAPWGRVEAQPDAPSGAHAGGNGAAPNAAAPTGIAPQLFVTSDRCMACHNGLTTPSGEDISIGSDWRSSMMANSARDPYWQAAVRREVLDHPTAAGAIQHECAACHMPMARYEAKVGGAQGEVFAHLPIAQAATPQALLAADGASCSMCHQIQSEGLGEEESFTAGFVVDTERPLDRRALFGPFEVDAGRTTIMRSASGFEPLKAPHIQSSELCATCHTLYTHALGPDGEVIGELPEQVPYLEWRHSAYRHDEQRPRSCQSCHMPVVEEETPVTAVLGQPRAAVSRHVFRGGNFFMPRILNRYRGELGVAALPQELDTTSRRTREHLSTAAARVTVERVAVSGGRLVAEVVLDNLAGHKLPTAYPSRRVWVHFTVRDGEGAPVFESGAFGPDGSIAGNDNDTDPGRYEPHYGEITSPEQVQIYEGILAGPDGEVTTGLITAVDYLKDNRLLPDGFDKTTAEEDIAVRGAAAGDGDFRDGGDRVRYVVEVGDAEGPFEVEAELWYQPIAYRWAQNLRRQPAVETDRFVGYYEEMAEGSAVVLARAGVTVR